MTIWNVYTSQRIWKMGKGILIQSFPVKVTSHHEKTALSSSISNTILYTLCEAYRIIIPVSVFFINRQIGQENRRIAGKKIRGAKQT